MGQVQILTKIFMILVLSCLTHLLATGPPVSQAFALISLPDNGWIARRRRHRTILSSSDWNDFDEDLFSSINSSDDLPSSRSGDLYSSDQLLTQLQVQSILSTRTFSSSSKPNATAAAIQDSKLSLQDLILLEMSAPRDPKPKNSGTARKTSSAASTPRVSKPKKTAMKTSSTASAARDAKPKKTVMKTSAAAVSLASSNLEPYVTESLSQTRMVASDVDGTLLTSDHGLHPRTRHALYEVLEAVARKNSKLEHFCLATGKTRAGALASISKADARLGEALSLVPGVFIQGLFCVDGSTRRVLWEQRLAPEPVLAVERQAAKWNVTLFAYRRDEIFASAFSHAQHISELHERYGEPQPQVIKSLKNVKPDNGPGMVNKLLIMDSDVERLSSVIRPALESIAADFGCEVTQAIPTMLEFLPPGCSKASGVLQLCRSLQVDTSELVAIGDAENDVGMLAMAGVGFAVGNAVPEARRVADVCLKESNNLGGAGVAIELVLEHLR